MLFPQQFLDDLKSQTDIVSVIGDTVALKKTGATWKGLCPFHGERTPSFNVNREKGFFKCFGCGVGGDVVKFVELNQKMSFPEAVQYLAQRAGIALPEHESGPEERERAAEREALLRLHELAAAFYLEQVRGPGGAPARHEVERRGLSAETIETFRYGYAPAQGRESLAARLTAERVPIALQVKSGLVLQREGGQFVDRFRHRLMIPIARETGAIVAFGGRALDDRQIPKYLNSPETPIYSKSRTLYGLDVTKSAIRKHRYSVLVEGYFDLAQVWQAGVQPVVALCGTALTPSQAKSLKRFTSKVVLSLDPDVAGQGAAARSSELLVGEGFQVNVALLPEGSDPDAFIQKRGGAAYVERLKTSRPYLDFLLDRAARPLDLSRPEHRRTFLTQMLTVAAMIPDPAARDQFADRLAHKARITEGVVRDEIRRAAAQRRTEPPAVAVPASVPLKAAESGLLWTLAHHPVEGLAAVAQLEEEDLEGLISAPILRLAGSLADVPADHVPDLLRERLNEGGRSLFERAARSDAAPAPAPDCVTTLKRLRLERDLAGVQARIERLGDDGNGGDRELAALWGSKKELLQRLEDLKT